MKTLSPQLQAHLASGTTTLCHCWRITLASGEQLGFTDHDRALAFDGTGFEAQSGFTASEIASSLGLAVDNLDAAGALESGRLDEARLKAGDFDHAAIEIWQVNWQDVSSRILLRKGHLGEVTYADNRFTAEVRGLAALFNQVQGRVFQYGCDAELGDARCGVNLDAATYRGQGTVASVAGATLEVSGLVSFADDWFTRGVITFAGARKLKIKRHRKVGSIARIDLWSEPAFAITTGAAVTLQAGCDKQHATCRMKFTNAANYRGFPHMPGTDFVTQVAGKGDPRNDGGKRQ